MNTSTVNSAVELTFACDRMVAGRSLVSIEAGSFEASASLDDKLDQGVPLPRVDWTAIYKPRGILNFGGGTSLQKMANCSKKDAEQMAALREWLGTFTLYYM
ncbi:MAG: hypothetical protein EOP06_22500 [Proteobacteria bacterium]|nr:MAG: hypothetical protein EOP06_22500 [Pseudomonadota bacterium]